MHFTTGHIQLTGSIWFRQGTPARPKPDDADQAKPARIPFNLTLTEAEFSELRHWLTADTPTLFQLPAPLRHLRRISPQPSGVTTLELELTNEQLPVWWNWDIVFPLTIRLAIPPPEYDYLTGILNREHWSADLMW